jgi:hypothetical protein
MSEQFEFINENLVSRRFHSYLEEMNIQDAFEQIFDDLINEDLSEAETDYVVHEILMPELVILFAEKYDALDSAYDYVYSEDNLNASFECFNGTGAINSSLMRHSNCFDKLTQSTKYSPIRADNRQNSMKIIS